MKWILLGFLLSTSVLAETSKIIPAFLEASRLYVQGEMSSENFYLRPDVRAALVTLEKSSVDKEVLEKYTVNKSATWPLREDDQYDQWTKSKATTNMTDVPELAVQATKFTVVDASDWLGDDIYAYFFITDGVIPTGKVTSIYKGTDTGQSFFFNEVDRAIFPLIGIPAKSPENHLIVDFGIIESDGDDVKEMQKLSAIIIDLAISVYASYDPQHAQVIVNLRKEIQALSDMLLSLNHDDRLGTGTLAWKASELEDLFKDRTWYETSQSFKGGSGMSSWEYNIQFRLIKK